MLALLALLVAVGGAGGDPAKEVSIDRPADADPVLLETSMRIRAELAIGGTTSRFVDCPVDPLAGPEDCPRDGTGASISLARSGQVTSIFVTSKLKTGLELRRQVRVKDPDGGADATLLAVRAVELLRDLKVEVAVAAQGQDSEEPKPLEAFGQLPPQPAGAARWHMLVGASALLIPWTDKSTFDPAVGAILGMGARISQHALLVAELAGPFAQSLPIALNLNRKPMDDRQLYAAIARVSIRFGRTSAVEGLFGAPLIWLSYMHLRLAADNLNGLSGQGVAPLLGFGAGYTKRVAKSVLLTGELAAYESFDFQVFSTDRLVTDSGYLWFALNLSAAIPLF